MTTPTDRELSDVTLALEKLWELDENRLQPGVDVCNLKHKSEAYKL